MAKKGDESGALARIKEMESMGPGQPEVVLGVGRVLLAMNRNTEALEYFNRALAASPQDLHVMAMIIGAHLKNGDTESAKKCYAMYKAKGFVLPPQIEAALTAADPGALNFDN